MDSYYSSQQYQMTAGTLELNRENSPRKSEKAKLQKDDELTAAAL
jgi:hypothetical protein